MHTALDGVDLEIARGEIVGLLGHNGAGKTTLMSLVAGLSRPDAGTISVHGYDVSREPLRARRHLGLAPQELGVYPPLTVRQNLRFFADLHGLNATVARQRIAEAADALALTEHLDRRVYELSGGGQRRVHTAMALIHKPALVLLDEPTAGVDVETRSRLVAYVRRLADEGAAVCYSTHYLPEVEELDATVVVLDHGRVVARGSIADLVHRHGGSAVEMVFAGTPPELHLPWPVDRDGGVLSIRTAEPHLILAGVLAGIGDHARDLTAMRVVRPSLDTVFLRLTGDRAGTDRVSTGG